MPDSNPPDAPSKLDRPKTPPPFIPGAPSFAGKDVNFGTLAPQAEPEPSVETGVDLSGKAKILFAAGRGKTGKTTLLRWIAEMSQAQGGQAVLADIDPAMPASPATSAMLPGLPPTIPRRSRAGCNN